MPRPCRRETQTHAPVQRVSRVCRGLHLRTGTWAFPPMFPTRALLPAAERPPPWAASPALRRGRFGAAISARQRGLAMVSQGTPQTTTRPRARAKLPPRLPVYTQRGTRSAVPWRKGRSGCWANQSHGQAVGGNMDDRASGRSRGHHACATIDNQSTARESIASLPLL